MAKDFGSTDHAQSQHDNQQYNPQHQQPINPSLALTPRGNSLDISSGGAFPLFPRGSELANDLLTRFKSTLDGYNESANAIKLSAALMDMETSQFPATMVLVYHVESKTAYVHPVILESSISQMPNIIETIPMSGEASLNQNMYSNTASQTETIHLEAAPSQILMSPNFRATVLEHLKKYNNHIEGVIICGGNIVPRHFNPETHFIPLCYYACQAVVQVLGIGNDQYLRFIDVAAMKKAPLNVKIAIDPMATFESSVGKKIPAPVAISIDQQIQQQINTLQGTNNNLGYLYGYMDLLYTAPPARQAYINNLLKAGNVGRDYEATRYRPMFICTMTDRPENQGINLEHFIVNAAMLLELERTGRWAEAFYRPEHKDNINPLTDFGAVGYDVNPMNPREGELMPIKTDGVEYSLSAHVALVNTVCFPSLEIAMDVPLCGDVSFMQNMFVVKDMLLQAAINLFGASFAQEFDCTPTSKDVNNVIKLNLGNFPSGEYTNHRGESRDIREVYNYLGWLNFTKGDSKQMFEWSRLNESNVYPQPKAQKLRYDAMMNITQGTFKQHDVVNRLVIEPAFIAACYRCMQKAGIGIYCSNTTMVQANEERGNAYWGVTAGMTPMGGLQQPPQQGRHGNFHHGYTYDRNSY